jgi:hypothetical protein
MNAARRHWRNFSFCLSSASCTSKI